MSPNPYWNVSLFALAIFVFAYIFLYFPFIYFFIGRPFDKKYQIKNYSIEKGVPIYSPFLRAINVTIGILLQPYRDKRIKSGFFSEIVRRRFIYQDNLYGEKINLRSNASPGQIFAAKMFWVGAGIFLLTIILFLIHNFLLYPEYARQKMSQ